MPEFRTAAEDADGDAVAVVEAGGVDASVRVQEAGPLHQRRRGRRHHSRDGAGGPFQEHDVAFADLGQVFRAVGRRVRGPDVVFQLRRRLSVPDLSKRVDWGAASHLCMSPAATLALGGGDLLALR